MCLTEPQCGTDLGLLKTKAVPKGDGTYEITGQKIFITSGDHDLTEKYNSFSFSKNDRCAKRNKRNKFISSTKI